MKKFISIILAMLMLFSVAALAGCSDQTDDKKNDETKAEANDEKKEELKLGLGIVPVYGSAANAEAEKNGSAEIVATAAAVLVNGEGKIVSCVIDAAQNQANFTADGKAVIKEEYKTKGELGVDYGMSAYGTDMNGDGVVKEWDEQTAAFAAAVAGKTLDEVKALVVDGYATEDIQKAGCTMGVADFVTAIEKAYAAAAASKATADDKLNLGIVTAAKATDATAEQNGKITFDVTFTAGAVDADGKLTAASTDAISVDLTFDAAGASTTDTAAAIVSKKAQGTDYGMSAYGTDLNGDGVVKEWDEQAAAFDAALIGKTASDIAGLEADGYGVEDVQKAGCTIGISDMVKAAVKAATVA